MHATRVKASLKLFLLLSALSLAVIAADQSAQLMVYRVTEPAGEPYISRILVTEDYLRLDQGQGDDGFILLNRKQHVIYSVNAEDQTILQINPLKADRALPKGVKYQSKIIEDQAMPTLPGKTTQYWGFYVNDVLCRSAVVVPELMPEAVRAHGEYLELLADQHHATQGEIPVELQDPCDQAVHVYQPLAVLDKGLPLREWGSHGMWELVDYRESFLVADENFTLPDGYQQIKLEALQEAL